jgi:hypothetical protein
MDIACDWLFKESKKTKLSKSILLLLLVEKLIRSFVA